MSVFNVESNHLTQPMFLGDDPGLARYETTKHEKFEELIQKSLSFYWRPEEVGLLNDGNQFRALQIELQDIFTNNLFYQILMDSVQGRSPAITLGVIVSDVALETWIMSWTFFETIHSRSYTHIIRNLYSDPSKVFDKIPENNKIIERALSICKYYDNLQDLIYCYKADKIRDRVYPGQLREVKKALYLCLHAINALEAIRFYASFVNTFNFFENMKIMEGNTKIMQFIARDENLHHQGTRYIINQLQSGVDGTDWLEIVDECKEEAEQIFNEAIIQEKDWVSYVYSKVEPPGLSIKLMHDFIDYISVPSMRKVGLDTSIIPPKKHPIPWVNKFFVTAATQVAKQETEVTSYLISAIDNDVDDDIIAKFRDKYLKSQLQK